MPKMETENEVKLDIEVKEEEITIEEQNLTDILTEEVGKREEEYFQSDPSDDEIPETVSEFSCRHCDFRTKYRGNLKQHLNSKHLGKVDLCQFCGKKYKDRSNLNRHIRIGHLGRKKNKKPSQHLNVHNCIYCDFSTPRRENLQAHMNSLHTLENVFPCKICSYVGTRIDSYRRHVQAMHQAKKKPYNCAHCDFQTFQRDCLNSHLDECHLDVKAFPCKFCEYRASFSGNLKRHMERKHS